MIGTVGRRDEIEVGVMRFLEKATKELGKQVADEILVNLCSYVDELEMHRKEK